MTTTEAPRRPRGRPKGATRQRVLDATLSLVAARGMEAVAVVDIEAAAGLAPGRGGFYRHFPSKEAAVTAAVERELERLRERQIDPPRDLPDLGAELAAGVAWLDELGPLIRIVMRDGGALPAAVRGLREVMADGGMTPGLAKVAESSMRAGRDPVASAVVVTMASIGFHLARQFFGGPVEGVDTDGFVAALAVMVEPGG